MRTGLILSLQLALSAAIARADTTFVSGDVSGTWTRSGGPYAVVGDLAVPAGCTLRVEPGVEVRFRGRYRFLVNGLLRADGTPAESILFTRDLPIEEHKWKGLRFVTAAPGCSLSWCRVEYILNDGPYPEVRGGAVYCERSSVVIRHCALCHNYSHNANANGGGGGVFITECSPVVESCHVFDNYVDSGGGICAIESSAAFIRGNTVEDNTATYSGGGMYLGVRSGPTVIGNIIRRNRCSAGWGGGGITLWNWYAISPVSKTLFSNLLAGNSAADAGGGIYTRYDLSFIYNNTIVGNQAARGGGIYVLNEGQFLPDVRNCIIWDNSAGQGPSIYLDPANSSNINAGWSNIAGGWPGPGIFDSVPSFADTTWFRLGSPSCCLDAGTSDGTPEFDFEGDARFDDPAIPNRGGGAQPWFDVGWDENPTTGINEESVRSVSARPVFATVGRGFGLPAGTDVFDPAGRLVLRSRSPLFWPDLALTRRFAPGVYLVRVGAEVRPVILTR